MPLIVLIVAVAIVFLLVPNNWFCCLVGRRQRPDAKRGKCMNDSALGMMAPVPRYVKTADLSNTEDSSRTRTLFVLRPPRVMSTTRSFREDIAW